MIDFRSAVLFAAFLGLLIAASAQAQPGPRGPGSPQAGGSAPGPGYGPGGRPGMHGRWGRNYTPGWSMMTPAERDEHRQRMAAARTPEECRAVRDEHRKFMEERAKEKGLPAMRGPRRDSCAAWGQR